MPSEPRWLDAAELIPVNAEVTERAGEPLIREGISEEEVAEPLRPHVIPFES